MGTINARGISANLMRVEAKIFSPIAYTLCFAPLGSLIISLTPGRPEDGTDFKGFNKWKSSLPCTTERNLAVCP